MLGYQVRVFEGSSRNIKVTTAADLAVVEALLAQSRVR
jgi:2-C-methyl-D-erythritol 4-phosphate cytidylyltransferase